MYCNRQSVTIKIPTLKKKLFLQEINEETDCVNLLSLNPSEILCSKSRRVFFFLVFSLTRLLSPPIFSSSFVHFFLLLSLYIVARYVIRVWAAENDDVSARVNMVDCGGLRCAQERRSFKKDLLSWGKKIPVLIGKWKKTKQYLFALFNSLRFTDGSIFVLLCLIVVCLLVSFVPVCCILLFCQLVF